MMPNGAKLIIFETTFEIQAAISDNKSLVVGAAIFFKAHPKITAQNNIPK